MSTYRVYMHARAMLSIKVEVDDDCMGAEDALDAAIDAAYNEMPTDICAQCAGWRRPWSMELGEWEVDSDVGDTKAVERVR